MSIGIDFGIGIDQNSWYRTRAGIVSKPKNLVSPITISQKLYYSPTSFPGLQCEDEARHEVDYSLH
jgi:hypothetical protein